MTRHWPSAGLYYTRWPSEEVSDATAQKVLDIILSVKYYWDMAKKKKPVTVAEAGRRGGKARAKKHSREQLRAWAKLGGWPKGRPRKTDTVKKEGE